MIFYFIPLIILILYNIKLAKPKGAEYLFYDSVSKDKSVCIKGIFAIIIMFSHVRGYIVCDNFFDNVYDKLLNFIGQQMVVMFLLYSGYGIIKSMRNNPHYMNDFLYKRVFRTHYHFLVALVFYIFIALVLGKGYSLVDYCFSLIGWSSIGNSNWYIFDTLVLYLITYFSFVRIGHPGWKNYYSCIIFSLLICIFILFLKIAEKQTYWYDTVLAFPLGMIFALCESKINNLFRKRQIYYWSTLLIAAAVYIFVNNSAYYIMFRC